VRAAAFGTIAAWRKSPSCAFQTYIERDNHYFTLVAPTASLEPLELGHRVSMDLKEENRTAVNDLILP
jgi:hypothetical protein